MPLKLHVVVHGAGPAFIRQPGCPCVRCAEPELPDAPTPRDLADLLAWVRQAHTSASLVIEEDGNAIDHTLVDIGMGVMNNLAALPTPARNQPISRVLITHGHLDHIAGLDGLLHALENGRQAGDFTRDEQPWPLPIFTTRHTWQHFIGPNPTNPVEAGMLQRSATNRLRFTDVTDAALELAALELHPALLVTPIPAEHLAGGVNYLFEFWPSGQQAEGQAIRVALCWDLLAFPAGRATDFWQEVQLEPASDPLRERMRDLDLLLVEMTNWRTRKGHICFESSPAPPEMERGNANTYGVRDLVELWQPHATRIVHYSGWNDRQLADGTWQGGEAAAHNVNPANGPVSDRHLRRAMRAALGETVDIDIAQPGMVLSFG